MKTHWRGVGETVFNFRPGSFSLDYSPTPARLFLKWRDTQQEAANDVVAAMRLAPSWEWRMESEHV